jgi:hypothetical protein
MIIIVRVAIVVVRGMVPLCTCLRRWRSSSLVAIFRVSGRRLGVCDLLVMRQRSGRRVGDTAVTTTLDIMDITFRILDLE